MEAYFHNDPRIEEWVDQITEKVFTVCLLTGADSEVEFQRGCQIVTKVTQLLQGIAVFPSEYLEDGLKQLLEQQLPDSRVINNFSAFQVTMNKMLHEGMTRALDTQNKENVGTLASSERNTPENTKDAAKEAQIVPGDEITAQSENAFNDEVLTEPVIAALASANSKSTNLLEAGVELQAPELEELMAIVPSIPNKTYGIIRKSEVPEEVDRLKDVLSNMFPDVSICWNLNLMGQKFLAQVQDILIYQHNPEQPCPVEKLNKEGWKVYECSSNDLMFPRRIQRGIRQIQRLAKPCKHR